MQKIFAKKLRLSIDENFDLILDNETKIELVYFRTGFNPEHYPTDKEWKARLLIERSNAVKAPSIALQLAITKKVQQV